MLAQRNCQGRSNYSFKGNADVSDFQTIIRRRVPLIQALGAMQASDAIEAEVQELTADLFREDEMGAVVRAHIRIENLLIQTIECLLPNPKHLKKLNLDYDGCVTLALALGLNEQFGPPFRALGKLRNDFAHRLDTSLSKQVVANLYDCLGPDDKGQVQACFKRIKYENEETRHVKRFANLEPGDQFKLIAITLWAAVRAAVKLHS